MPVHPHPGRQDRDEKDGLTDIDRIIDEILHGD